MGIGSGPPVGFFPERLLSEKESDMEIPEELVEETILQLDEILKEGEPLRTLRKIKEESSDWYWQEVWARYDEKWKAIITRILKAVVDGELDEALGVVGRGLLEHTLNEDKIWWEKEQYPWPKEAGAELDFIALSGTGKEEEKDGDTGRDRGIEAAKFAG